MDLPFPWTFVLFTLCFVALIAGALLGFAVGFRTGGRQERFRLVKEKLKRNKAAICRWQKERYEYARQVTRIVDMFLEHSRIWYFYNDGEEELFLTSADWMRRNLNRRIETAFPILNAEIKRNIIDILNIQLQDNVKACLIDEHLHNNFKRDGNPVKVRAQLAVYEYLKNKI